MGSMNINIPAFHADVKAKAIRREAAIAAILELLGQKRMTSPELAEAIGLNTSTMFIYLRHMASERLVHRTKDLDRPNGALYWQLGAEVSLIERDEKEDPRHAPKRKITPARQIGIARDPMIAALFGPAQTNT